MPLIRVELNRALVTDESAPKIIAALTDALVEAVGDDSIRANTWVVVEAEDPRLWGAGGKSWTPAAQ